MAKRILIIDDEADLVDTVSARLEFAGYSVDEAANGREGLGAYIASLIRREPFDLILLDIKMPGLSGMDVLECIRKEEKIRGLEKGEGVAIIMLTALRPAFEEAFNKGCDDYIIKPFEEEVLLKKIEEKIRTKH